MNDSLPPTDARLKAMGRTARQASVSPALVRQARGHFATGVTVVTSRRERGRPPARRRARSLRCRSPHRCCSCASERSSHTLAAIRDHEAVRDHCWRRTGATVGELRPARRGRRSGGPSATSTPADRKPASGRSAGVLDFGLEHCLDGGDHEIVVGRLLALELNGTDVGPLLHYQGRLRVVAGRVASPPHTVHALHRRPIDRELSISNWPERSSKLAEVLLGFDRRDRLGIVVDEPLGGNGASTLVLATVTAFSNHFTARSSDFWIYPDYFAFLRERSGRCARSRSHPRTRRVVVGHDPDRLLEAINDRGITRLLVPIGRPETPRFEREPLASYSDSRCDHDRLLAWRTRRGEPGRTGQRAHRALRAQERRRVDVGAAAHASTA